MKRSNLVLNLILIIYLFLSLLLFYIGPLEYTYVNISETIFFTVAYFLIYVYGFNIGLKNIKVSPRFVSTNKKKFFNIILITSTIVYFSFGIIDIFSTFDTINPLVVIRNFFQSIENPSLLYFNNLEENSLSSGGIYTQLLTLFSPLTFISIPIGVILYNNMSKAFKIFWIGTVITNIISSLMTGQSFGIFKIIISFIVTIYIKQLNQKNKTQKIQKNWKNILIYLSIILILFIFLVIFSNNVISRAANLGSFIGNVYINYENWMFRLFPKNLHSTLIYFISYFTQGYYGFSLLFNYNWLPTFPFGNSMFLLRYSNLLGFRPEAIFERTYINRMRNFWSPTVNWHTVFTWWANDFNVIGVILVMLIFGIILGISFKKAKESSLIGLLIFILMIIFTIFIPMNNVVFSNPTTFLPFFVYLAIFFIKYNLKLIINKKL